MTKVINDKRNLKAKNPVPGVLVAFGILLLIGAGGNIELIDAMNQENERVGYEKHKVDSNEQKESAGIMLVGGILTGAGIVGLARKEYSKQGR